VKEGRVEGWEEGGGPEGWEEGGQEEGGRGRWMGGRRVGYGDEKKNYMNLL